MDASSSDFGMRNQDIPPSNSELSVSTPYPTSTQPSTLTSYSALCLVWVWRGGMEIYTGAMHGSNFIMNQAQAHTSRRVLRSRKARSRYPYWHGCASYLAPSLCPLYVVYPPTAPTFSSPASPSARPRG
ncbi:hypothetical protein FIBSPDRAFT_849568 [Athelia psychrophila]|uniref:Uncharacterized protein n=1 Tax=Athelia psychrophila TaxID=1759441 RepID=A0A166UE00_9AGAM|nr:hypothetical protein FIBSPDRAFT_849568 [Fibularhizoctonia sp. CBS 109695]